MVDLIRTFVGLFLISSVYLGLSHSAPPSAEGPSPESHIHIHNRSGYGKDINKRTVFKFQQFNKYFPGFVRSMTAQYSENEIVPSTAAQLLTWTHY